MAKSVIKKYKIHNNEVNIFKTNDIDYEKLKKFGLFQLDTKYLSDSSVSYFHHNSKVYVMVNRDEMYLIGSKNSVNRTKEDLESFIGELKEITLNDINS